MDQSIALQPGSPQEISGSLYDNPNIFGGRLQVTAFGRFYDSLNREEDWTFTNLRAPNDAEKNSSLQRNLPKIARAMRFTELLVPSPVDFNARICYERDLVARISLGSRLVVKRGINADGCRLQPGQAYGISLSKSAVVAACYPHDPRSHEKVRVAVANAGLKSCIDEQAAQTGLISRKPESVVESLVDSMGCSGERKYRRKRVGVVIILPTPSYELSYPWNNPTWGEQNRLRCEYIQEKIGKGCISGPEKEGRIELHEIITEQFVTLGIPLENIHLIRTEDVFGNFRWKDGKEVWYSAGGDFPTRRNLIIVKHSKLPSSKKLIRPPA